jgi:hypothetical protein
MDNIKTTKHTCHTCGQETALTQKFLVSLIVDKTHPPTGGLGKLTYFHGNQHNYSWTWSTIELERHGVIFLRGLYEKYKD